MFQTEGPAGADTERAGSQGGNGAALRPRLPAEIAEKVVKWAGAGLWRNLNPGQVCVPWVPGGRQQEL